MVRFNLYASLFAMLIGVVMASQAIVICGFVSVNIWAAASEIIKAAKRQGEVK